MNKRIIFVIMAVMLIFILAISACKPAPAEPETEEAPAAEEAPEEEVAEEPAEEEVEEAAPTEVPEPTEEPVVEEAPKGGVYHMVAGEEPDTLDPHKSSTALSAAILRYVGDPLIFKGLNNDYLPGLAKEWSVSEDGLVYTFFLRDDVKFHDGTPLNAEACVKTYERAISPELASPVAGPNLGTVDKFEIVDDYTFKVYLLEPNADFVENLTDTGRLMPLSPTALEEMGDDFGRHPVGTGPWMFKEWVSASSISLVRNPDYNWGPSYVHQGPVYLEELVWDIITESATSQAAFENGELESLALAPADIQWMMDTGEYEFLTYDRKGVGLFIEFNVTKPPFDDIKVREAFNYAIDKQSILDIVLEGFGKIAYGPLPPTIRGYWEGIEEYTPSYDPVKAAQLLDEAGWILNESTGIREKDGQPFEWEIFSMPVDTWTAALQLVQADLAALGVTMGIQSFEFGTLLEKAQAGEHNALVMGYTYLTPGILHIWFHSSNIGTGLTLSHNNDPELDAMIEESMILVDWPTREELLKQIQIKIVDEYLWVPIFNQVYYVAVQPWVRDVFMHPDAYLVLNDTYIEK